MATRADFVSAARARGMIQDCTDEQALAALAAERVIPAYIGFDATADSLHVAGFHRECPQAKTGELK